MLLHEIETVVAMMRAQGIKKLKTSELEIELEAKPEEKKSETVQEKPGTYEEIKGEEPPTDEQMLYWSSGFEPEPPKPTPDLDEKN